MKKILSSLLVIAALALPAVASAQIFSQRQLIIPPFGMGVIVSTSTANGRFLEASSSPSLTSIFATSTAATSSIALLTTTAFAVSGAASGCATFGAGGYLTSTGSVCGSGGGATFGQAWEIGGNGFTGFLAPTTTQKVWIGQASSTQFSVSTKAWFGGTSTTTIDIAGNVVIPSGSNLTVTGKTDGCATWATGVLNSTGSACGSGGGGIGDPFTHTSVFGQTTSATSTLLALTGSAVSLAASSTAWFDQIKVGSSTSSGMATSTFFGNIRVVGNIEDDGISNAIVIDSTGGSLIAYAGTTCTNQFVRSLSALGAASCNTVSLTSDVTGTLGYGNGGTGTTTAVTGQLVYYGASAHQSTATTTLTTTGFPFNVSGTLGSLVGGLNTTWTWWGLSTTSQPASSNILVSNGAAGVYGAATSSQTFSAGFSNSGTNGSWIGGTTNTTSLVEHRSFSYSTTSWTGTTTQWIEIGYGEVWKSAQCSTDAGTVNVDLYHAASHLNLLNASTTIGTFTFTTNNTITTSDLMKVDIGTPASSPTRVTCTEKDTI